MKRIDTLLPREVLRRTGHIALGLFEGGKASSTLTAIHPGLLAFTQAIIKKEQFKAQAGKSLSFYFKSGRTLVKILILGLGKGADFGIEKAREAAGLIAGSAAAQKAKQVGFLVDSFLTEKTQKEISKLSEAIAEAVELACYRFKNYKVSKNGQAQNHFTPEKIFLVSVNRNHLSEIRSGINCGLALASGVTIARDLINEPSNKMNPQIFSERARGLARKFGLKFHVLEKKDLRKEKMGALLAVGQGSVIPPRMVVLSYEGRKSSSPICLVGKGITFDTGGISIKPSKDMEKMKYDMSGGAAVLWKEI
jgi:leucyl aminopeptidase